MGRKGYTRMLKQGKPTVKSVAQRPKKWAPAVEDTHDPQAMGSWYIQENRLVIVLPDGSLYRRSRLLPGIWRHERFYLGKDVRFDKLMLMEFLLDSRWRFSSKAVKW